MVDFALPVLLVDDYASMRRTIRSMLQQIGFTNITEDDGSNALTLIRDQYFALIVSDLLMTPVSGLDLLREVRAQRRLVGTLFIMVTGAAHQDVVLAARGLKVDGYVVKPFDTNTLRRKIFQIFARFVPNEGDVPKGAPVPTPAPAIHDAENSELRALKLAINALYELLDSRLRSGDTAPHDDLVSIIRVQIDRAVELGVEPDYRQQLDAMLGKLSTLRPAASTGLSGALYRVSPPTRGAMAQPDRRQASAARPDERRSGREARRYKRFGSPALHVTLNDRIYRTVDWSIGGMSLSGYSGTIQPDKQIKVAIRVEGDDDDGQIFADRAIVVRNNSAAGTLAIRFTSQTSATLKVLEYLTRRQEKPVEVTLAPAEASSPGG